MRKLIVLLLGISNVLHAQTVPDPKLPALLPPSPEAAALTKNADLSVGLFNGAAQASIPLYEIKLKNFSLPISLNYAANGLKVDEIPSRVGLGWSLSAGGVVTRIVNGKPDDLFTRYNPPGPLNQSLASLLYYYNLTSESEAYDAEPDEFRIAAPGLSGKFVLDTNGNPIIIPFANYKIQVIGTYPYNEVIIVNPEGVKYFFGGTATEITTNHSIQGKLAGLTQVTTGFFLRKIETPNKDSINFYYSVVATRQFTGVTHTVSIAAGQLTSSCPLDYCPTGGTNFTETVADVSYNSLLLDSIKATTGDRVQFTYEDRPDSSHDKRLINAYIYTGHSIKKYALNYYSPSSVGGYIGHERGNYNKRFFLTQLQATATLDSVQAPDVLTHKFDYIDLDGLPPRLSYGQDHYGFFNGINNQNLLPASYESTPYGSFGSYANADRSSNGSYAVKGMLRKITYPTGGFDSLFYEANQTPSAQQIDTKVHEIIYGQGSGASSVATYTSTTCLTPKRNNVAQLFIGSSISPTCTECQAPEEGVDKIVEVFIRNITTGSNTVLFRQLRNYINTVDTITLLANNCYQLQLKVYGDYSYGQAELVYDTAAQDTYITVWKDAPGVRVKHIASLDPVSGLTTHKFYKYTALNNLTGSSITPLLGFSYASKSYKFSICSTFFEPGSYMVCIWDVLSSNSNSYQFFSDNNLFGFTRVLESNDSNFANGVTEHVFEASPYLSAAPVLGNDLRGAPTNTHSWFNGFETATRNYNNTLNLVREVNNYFHVDTAVNKSIIGVIAKRRYEPLHMPDDPVSPDEIDPYEVTQYNYQSNWIQHDSTITKEYDANGSLITSKSINYFGSPNNTLPVRTETYDSKGQLVKEERKYPTDYSGQAPYQRMINENIISPLIESKEYAGNNLIYTTKNNYFDFSADTSSSSPVIIRPQTIQVQKGNGPLETRIRFSRYDPKGNAIEVSKEGDQKISYVWDYNNQYPVAEVKNADSASTAYTSFETDGGGNWSVFSANRNSTMSITGKKSYNLADGNISKGGLILGTVYVVSYWAKTGSKNISGATSTIRSGRVINGWTYFEHTVTPTSATISINGSGLIDELRLYPKGAQMTTYTYEPLVGVTSMSDANSQPTYYEYDGFGRLKNIRDFNGDIVKNFQYNYASSCGGNCAVLPMLTLAGSNTIGYPVGVFSVKGKLLGNASTRAQYLSLWNSDTSNTNIGTLSAGSDSLHFNLSLNSGKTAPAGVTGCRYYQYDLPYTQLDAVRNTNGCYVDFGDGYSMRLGNNKYDTAVTPAPNTVMHISGGLVPYFVHTYPNSNLKTITIYHNDGTETPGLDNYFNPATSLIKIKNVRGNYPQYMPNLESSCFQDSTANTVSNIANWNTITSLDEWGENLGDGVNPAMNLRFAQDFMAGKNLLYIYAANDGYYNVGYRDSTFKLSRLKSNWNTYFNIKKIWLCDEHWDREDLSGFKELDFFQIVAGNQKHSNDPTNNPVVPIPSSVIDNILIQIASGAGQNVNNGQINIYAGGTTRTSASNSAVAQLNARGWAIRIEGVVQ